jgi:carbonic anhydrase
MSGFELASIAAPGPLTSLLLRNKSWATKKRQQDPQLFTRLTAGQAPTYLIIGCSDSRIPVEQIAGLEPGEAFVHRNIANLVVPTDINTTSVIEYAVRHLRVQNIIVCGHSGCGAVKAAMTSIDLGVLNPWLQNIRDLYRRHEPQLKAVSDELKRFRMLSELNVIEQCRNVAKTITVQQSYATNGYPLVHGLMFPLENGLLTDLNVNVDSLLLAGSTRKDMYPSLLNTVNRPLYGLNRKSIATRERQFAGESIQTEGETHVAQSTDSQSPPESVVSDSDAETDSDDNSEIRVRASQVQGLMNWFLTWLNKAVQELVDRGDSISAHGQRGHNPGPRQRPADDAGGFQSTKSLTEAGSTVQWRPPPSQKRARFDGEGEDDDEADQDDNDGHDDKRARYSLSDSRKFACPFFKRSPRKYRTWRNCIGPGWPSVRRVKLDLVRAISALPLANQAQGTPLPPSLTSSVQV